MGGILAVWGRFATIATRRLGSGDCFGTPSATVGLVNTMRQLAPGDLGRELRSTATQDDDNIGLRKRLATTEPLANETLAAVAGDGIAHAFGRHHPQTRAEFGLGRLRMDHDHEVARTETRTAALNLEEFATTKKPAALGEGLVQGPILGPTSSRRRQRAACGPCGAGW